MDIIYKFNIGEATHCGKTVLEHLRNQQTPVHHYLDLGKGYSLYIVTHDGGGYIRPMYFGRHCTQCAISITNLQTIVRTICKMAWHFPRTASAIHDWWENWTWYQVIGAAGLSIDSNPNHYCTL